MTTPDRCPSCGTDSRWYAGTHARTCEYYVDPRAALPLAADVLSREAS